MCFFAFQFGSVFGGPPTFYYCVTAMTVVSDELWDVSFGIRRTVVFCSPECKQASDERVYEWRRRGADPDRVTFI